MKVGFLIHGLDVSSCRYRVLQYFPYLKDHGIETSVLFYPRTWFARVQFPRLLKELNLLYIHRKLFHPLEFWLIRKKARKIIYDFDDALMYRSSGPRGPHSISRRTKFAYMARRVDTLVAGNQFLQSEALPYNSHVEIIPTSIDLSHYGVMNKFHPEGPLIIGWLGSSSTLKYLKLLMPTLEALYQHYPHFQLKIVCDQFLESPILPVIQKRWSLDEEEADLKSFDIGIMPLVDDLWSRGKCGLKILQYYGAGVPAVVTPVGINRDIVKDGVNGFWARHEEEWKDRLLRLIQDGTLRREMGLRGRETVKNEYSLEANGPRILAVLQRTSAL
jgi:glycosyltransferase involved in cell wall biosynthesis